MSSANGYDSTFTREWSSSFENYKFIPKENGTCIFAVEQNSPEVQAEELETNWEKYF